MESPQVAAPAWLDEASQAYEQRWQTLISTTNWEKGRIISEWRAALIEAEAPATEFSDDAWSRRVGGVTGQHVGRLRRVWDRFGATASDYAGLFWSHFQAAVDWNDAEMWLEGAVQNQWSVAALRARRAETLGEAEEAEPADALAAAELDEDFVPATERLAGDEARDLVAREELVRLPGGAEGDELTGEAEAAETAPWEEELAEGETAAEGANVATAFRPFEHLPELPDDLTDAFESFKLALLRHKSSGWAEIDRDSVILALDALKALATAPSGDE